MIARLVCILAATGVLAASAPIYDYTDETVSKSLPENPGRGQKIFETGQIFICDLLRAVVKLIANRIGV